MELGHQGTIQFALGTNGNQIPSNTYDHAEEEEGEKVKTSFPALDDGTRIQQNCENVISIHQDHGGNEIAEINIDTNPEIGTSRKPAIFNSQESQEGDNLPDEAEDIDFLEDSQMFEDSFPGIHLVDLPGQDIDDKKLGQGTIQRRNSGQIMLEKHIVDTLMAEARVKAVAAEAIVGPCGEGKVNTSPIPLINNNNAKCDFELNKDKSLKIAKFREGGDELMGRTLPNKSEDSLEVILEKFRVNDVQATTANDIKKKSDLRKCDKFSLSDSDAAAIIEIVANEESDFMSESEELFPKRESSTEKELPRARQDEQVQNISRLSVIQEQGELNSLDWEDFIPTQVSPSTQEGEKPEQDVFEDSSSDTEASSSETQGSTNTQLTCHPGYHEPVKFDGIVGTKHLKVIFIKSAAEIPNSYFTESEFIGIGINLVLAKTRHSGARHGIGSRILGKHGSKSSLSNGCKQQRHSVAIYNGSDTIWVLRWFCHNNSVHEVRKNERDDRKLGALISKMERGTSSLVIFDLKETIQIMLKLCGAHIFSKFPPGSRMLDPGIAQWVWDFNEEDWRSSQMTKKLVAEYVREDERQISKYGWGQEVTDAYFAWKVMTVLKDKLLDIGLWDHFIRIEMPALVPLMLMEMNGFGLDAVELTSLKRILQFQATWLELKAFQLAGRQFSLSSTKEISQILYREIGLKHPKGGKGTSKEILKQLNHELPGIIIEWRKVNCALQQHVIPFQQERNLKTGRVHGWYKYLTATGRVIMAEPSLQLIPRDFDLQSSVDMEELKEIKNNCKINFGTKVADLIRQLDSDKDASFLGNMGLISLRNAFVPCGSEFSILAVDYSQLELRILAHLSEDSRLVEALNQETDVFLEMASRWKRIPKTKVTYAIRQDTKAIVYGIIYGIGVKALSAQLEMDEKEAAMLQKQFMDAYPGIQVFLDKAVEECKKRGYIETMTGRRRYLPLIRSGNQALKAKAARQAVNSQIQGSAADLVKSAMARIHSTLTSKYPESAIPMEWNKIAKSRRSSSASELNRTAYIPLLNLHDELIFEVRQTELKIIANIIKNQMESCQKLRVKLPVVIKVGETWGALKTFDC